MAESKITNTESQLMNQAEAAKYLGTTVGTLNAWRHYTKKDKHGNPRQPIPFVRWGNRIRYRKIDLDLWIESQMENQPIGQ